MSSLADRIRGIVSPARAGSGPGAGPTSESARPAPPGLEGAQSDSLHALASVLGGEWRDAEAGRCFVVEKRAAPEAIHGRVRVGDLALRLAEAATSAPMMSGGAPARPPFVFFDLETTGLSGGAGTYAFLVGCGWFETTGAFVTRQHVLARFADERPLLATVAAELARAGALVSFNGKSFDAPLLETRYLFHRLQWAGGTLPHIDVLHSARRFWGGSQVARAFQARGDHDSSCSLVALERQVLGARRIGDVPGFEIPGRYFRFVRSGDARPLAAVLEHNRLDLLSLAGLMARLLHLVRAGAAAALDAREALALGRLYWRAGLDARAREAFARAAAMDEGPNRIEALRALAVVHRRARQYEEAAGCWRGLLEIRGCPSHVACEATEALAIHHEHRVRDLEAARSFALRSLETGRRPAWAEAVRHRLARIERKMEEQASLMLEPSESSLSLPSLPAYGSPRSARRISS